MSEPRRSMTNPPLPRHPALQPLSREHFGGLVLARDLVRAAGANATRESRRDVLQRFAAAWDAELAPHFADEERLLGPLIADPEQFRRLIAEHREIERFAAHAAGDAAGSEPDPEWFGRAGRLLHDHIRWEERVLFPAIEASMSDAAAEEVGRHTAIVEAQRPGARRRHDLFPEEPEGSGASGR